MTSRRVTAIVEPSPDATERRDGRRSDVDARVARARALHDRALAAVQRRLRAALDPVRRGHIADSRFAALLP